MWGCGMQGCWDMGYRDVGMQGCGDEGRWGCRDMGRESRSSPPPHVEKGIKEPQPSYEPIQPPPKLGTKWVWGGDRGW